MVPFIITCRQYVDSVDHALCPELYDGITERPKTQMEQLYLLIDSRCDIAIQCVNLRLILVNSLMEVAFDNGLQVNRWLH